MKFHVAITGCDLTIDGFDGRFEDVDVSLAAAVSRGSRARTDDGGSELLLPPVSQLMVGRHCPLAACACALRRRVLPAVHPRHSNGARRRRRPYPLRRREQREGAVWPEAGSILAPTGRRGAERRWPEARRGPTPGGCPCVRPLAVAEVAEISIGGREGGCGSGSPMPTAAKESPLSSHLFASSGILRLCYLLTLRQWRTQVRFEIPAEIPTDYENLMFRLP